MEKWGILKRGNYWSMESFQVTKFQSSRRIQFALPLLAHSSEPVDVPLSFQQERIWFDCIPGTIDYVRPTRITIRVMGPLDMSVLRRAVTELAHRHEVLRTVYRAADGRPDQAVHRVVPVTEVDLRDVPASERTRVTRLGAGSSLTRWTVARQGADEHEIVVELHPAVHDSWASGLLLREVTALYGAFAQGEEPSLADRPVQYRDYVAWQREAISSVAMRAQLAHWRRRLTNLPPALELPVRRSPAAPGVVRRETLHADLPLSLHDYCRDERVDLLTVTLAAFMSLLHRYTGATDICVASTLPNRDVAGTEHLLGAFANTVMLRCDLSSDLAYRELVERVHQVVFDAVDNQEYPFAELVRVLNPRVRTGGPLSRATFDLSADLPSSVDFTGVPATVEESPGGIMDTDLAVAVQDRTDRISLLWTYDDNIFDASTMRQMLDGYLVHLDAATTAPDSRLDDLPLFGERQRRQILTEWRGGTAARSSEPLVHTAVERRAREAPAAVAVRDDDQILTYAELDGRASQLATHLQELGAEPDDVVGILLPRGIDLAVADLGVLKAGVAYLSLDLDHPADRLTYLCRDADVALVVTTRQYVSRVPRQARPLLLESLPAGPAAQVPSSRAQPHNLAYVMYTSGSTGRPKGVMVEHAALASFTSWYRREYGVRPADRLAMINSPGFDASVMDLWPALTAGACVHVADHEIRLSPERLQAWLLENRISIVFLTTALAEPLLDLPWPSDTVLRSLQTGGEVFRRRPSSSLPFTLVLAYGPTETTVYATVGVVEPANGSGGGQAGPLPDIGSPLATTIAYVLDQRLRPVPPGVRGELYLGGTGLARGYLRDPGLTAERFVPDPFGTEPGGRLYRTGDLVRFLPDGRLDFLGRTDGQIKLRGNRVEPGEIETVLCRHQAIAQTHVTVRHDGPGGDKRLVAYLVPRAGHDVPPPADLRRHLERDLPGFMVPAAWVPLERLPLKASGKVDADALPAPCTPDVSGRETHEPPATQTERVVAGIWCEVLELPQVSVRDNFFDLGGHSMLIYRVRDRLVERMGRSPAIVKFFQYSTVRGLSRYIDSGAQADGSGDHWAEDRSYGERRGGLTRLEMRRAQRARVEGRQ